MDHFNLVIHISYLNHLITIVAILFFKPLLYGHSLAILLNLTCLTSCQIHLAFLTLITNIVFSHPDAICVHPFWILFLSLGILVLFLGSLYFLLGSLSSSWDTCLPLGILVLTLGILVDPLVSLDPYTSFYRALSFHFGSLSILFIYP